MKITYALLFYSFLFLTLCKYFTEQKILDFFEGRVIFNTCRCFFFFFWHKKNCSVGPCSRMQCFTIFLKFSLSSHLSSFKNFIANSFEKLSNRRDDEIKKISSFFLSEISKDVLSQSHNLQKKTELQPQDR